MARWAPEISGLNNPAMWLTTTVLQIWVARRAWPAEGVRSAAMEVLRKDVVVVGLGGFGSAALWRLAQRGADVAGIERHGIGHHLGSSHGATRLFRIACQEHPGLAAVALKSLELWAGLGERPGSSSSARAAA
jgi:FAD dependent oxidoreductase